MEKISLLSKYIERCPVSEHGDVQEVLKSYRALREREEIDMQRHLLLIKGFNDNTIESIIIKLAKRWRLTCELNLLLISIPRTSITGKCPWVFFNGISILNRLFEQSI